MTPASNVRPKFDPLLSEGLLKEADLLRAAAEALEGHLDVEQVLLRRYKISKARLGAALEKHYKCRFVAFDPRLPAPRLLLRNLKPSYLRTDHWVPLEAKAGVVTVLIDDPNHLIKRDSVRALLPSAQIEYCVGLKEDIEAFIDHFFDLTTSAPSPVVHGEKEGPTGLMSAQIEDSAIEVLAEEGLAAAPDDDAIAELVTGFLRQACSRGASDIHIEPYPDDGPAEVRLRIDGRCVPYRTVAPQLKQALVTRIKLLANLDISERRLPQEGKIALPQKGSERAIELQVATMPTLGGLEDVILRVLPGSAPLPIEMLRFSERNHGRLMRLLSQPAGLILIAGPTGAGKTTTLHAALLHLNRPHRKIWTVEDPIEITQPGLRQVQVHAKAGLTSAAALRALLRTDGDVILCGELRDREIGDLAIQAALTGHLVLAAVPTGNAAETAGRLLDLGHDPFNLADALLGIVAQRLVRRLCEACFEPYAAGDAELHDLSAEYGEDPASLGAAPGTMLYRPRGCPECHQAGYRGRLALHEILEATDGLRRLLQRRHPVEEIRAQALRDGMRTLKQDGIEKILLGVTDLREVRAACIR